MNISCDVFVEGDSDEVFLKCLLKHLSLPGVRTNVIGGGVSYLRMVENNIHKRCNGGSQIAVLLDANSSPAKRTAEFRRTRDDLGLPIEDSHCFLLPNNRDAGDLETLLERISAAEHRAVYDCFEEYENCLRTRSMSRPYHVPDQKAKIYAYCSANGIETQPKKRNYGDGNYWDLEARAVRPLTEFLRSLSG